jgi:hypothetical protein
MGQMMAIDTLGYVKVLTGAGVPPAQAEAHAEALRDKLIPELVTKQDLKDATGTLCGEISEVREELSAVRAEMWRIALAVVLGTATLTTAFQKLLQ